MRRWIDNKVVMSALRQISIIKKTKLQVTRKTKALPSVACNKRLAIAVEDLRYYIWEWKKLKKDFPQMKGIYENWEVVSQIDLILYLCTIYTDERYFRLNIFEGELYDNEYEWNYFKLVYANADGEEYEYLFAVESETMHDLIEKALCLTRDYEPMNRPELSRPSIQWATIHFD